MTEKIAIPLCKSEISTHFGHTERYLVLSVKDKHIISEEFAIPPAHEYGSHPRFLKEIGCHTVISCGMGMKAQALFQEYGIRTIIGVDNLSVNEIIEKYLSGHLQSGENRCDH